MIIYILTNPNYLGDANQLIAVELAIEKISTDHQFCIKQESDFNPEQLEDGDLVFVSGSHGLEIVQTIKQVSPKTQILWTGHQYFDQFDTIQHWPDIIALPQTALSKKQTIEIREKCSFITTMGVAHGVNEETVKLDYAKFKGKLPDPIHFKKQVGIVLAGDAPTPDKEMKFFSVKDAENQAELIAADLIARGYDKADTAIMITNGPRTGQHDPVTKRPYDPSPHRSRATDKSSQAFKAKLVWLLPNCQIDLYDFQFEDLAQGSSAYKPMLKQVADSEVGLWYVPAESVSMVTECSGYLALKKKTVVIYHPESENNMHIVHAEDIKNQGLAVDIKDTAAKTSIKGEMEDAAAKIAQHVITFLNQQKADTMISPQGLTFFGEGKAVLTPSKPNHLSFVESLS